MQKQQTILYTQPGCGPCLFVKRFLTTRGVEFVEKNIRTDEMAFMRIKELGYMQTPVLEFANGGHTGGFNAEKINTLIDGGK